MRIVQDVSDIVWVMETPDHRLKQARRDAGYSSATSAALANKWNANTYRSHENGKREFKKAAAHAYAGAFKVSVQWLLFGEGKSASPGLLAGYVADDGRVVRDSEGLDIELIGLRHEGLGLALLVQTMDLDPKYSLNDVIMVADRELDFSNDESHTAGDRVWCYLEVDGYRPMIAEILKLPGTSNLQISFPRSYGERIMPGIINTVELQVPTQTLRSVRPIQAVVMPEGWHYRVADVVERMKASAS